MKQLRIGSTVALLGVIVLGCGAVARSAGDTLRPGGDEKSTDAADLRIDRSDVVALNRRLGRGINMGNMFEAPDERAWNNPYQTGYFKKIAELGFTHVRLPVRWEPEARSMVQPPYTIRPEFLRRIQQVIDEALEEGLMVVLNMHHHEALFADPRGQKDRFLGQWRQIAAHFKDYPDTLIFELLNEPHGELTPERWNDLLVAGLRVIRQSNPRRAVMIGTAEWGGLSALAKLKIPDDPNIIITVHYYGPFAFTHQGASWVGPGSERWLGTRWLDTEAERQAIRTAFAPAVQMRDRLGIPIHLGEFGAYSRADMDSRVRWTRFVARLAEEHGFSWAYWEFSAGFGIYDREERTMRQPLVNALLHDRLPPATPVKAIAIWSDGFGDGPAGWSLTRHREARADATIACGEVQIEIQHGGTERWHVQWSKPDVRLEKGKRYRVTFRMASPAPRTIQAYAGRASEPWTAYSAHESFTLDDKLTEHAFLFTMTAETDSRARIVFDIAGAPGSIRLDQVRLEELQVNPDDVPRP
ncbi:MAG: cellulase family glycosylhydrolase [Phycisphaeraceae bacterium]|nr:cellulase family glycosylhydrolase [Phycisphaeraceae bacterium]